MFPYWDAQGYLISVASQVPDIVMKHIETIHGHVWYISRAIEALCLIEADKAEGADSKEAIQNLCDQNNMLSPWDLRKIKYLLSNDQKNSK